MQLFLVSFSLIINGSAFGFFNSSRRLRQGTFIFVFVYPRTELLSCLLRKINKVDLITRLGVGRRESSMCITHVFLQVT